MTYNSSIILFSSSADKSFKNPDARYVSSHSHSRLGTWHSSVCTCWCIIQVDWILQTFLLLSISPHRSLRPPCFIHTGSGVFRRMARITKKELACWKGHYGNCLDDWSVFHQGYVHTLHTLVLCHTGLDTSSVLQAYVT